MICQRCSMDLTTAVQLKEASLSSISYFKQLPILSPPPSFLSKMSVVKMCNQESIGSPFQSTIYKIPKNVMLKRLNTGGLVNEKNVNLPSQIEKTRPTPVVRNAHSLLPNAISKPRFLLPMSASKPLSNVCKLLNNNSNAGYMLSPSVVLRKISPKMHSNNKTPEAVLTVSSKKVQIRAVNVARSSGDKNFKVQLKYSPDEKFKQVSTPRFFDQSNDDTSVDMRYVNEPNMDDYLKFLK